MQILGWHWGVWALTAVDGQSKIVGILEVKWNANLITRKRWIQKHEIPLLDWFFFSQKALYVIMYSPKNCKDKYKSLFKSWQWRIRPNQSIQPIFMAEWKRKIANTEEMLSITKYLFADKSDLARGFEAVRHFNIRKFKNESNHNLVLKYWYTWGPFLTPLLSFWLHAADALHAMCKYLFLENKRQKSNFMEEHFLEHFFE